MKKLLSILGAVGLVATASTSVVACGSKISNNPNYGYKDFEGWVKKSADNNENEIIFIGGRTDVDTLSFLAAREAATGKHVDVQNINSLTSNKAVKQMDNDFNDWTAKDDSNNSLKSINRLADQGLDPEKAIQADSTLVGGYFWGKDSSGNESKPLDDNFELHSILVDNIAEFFKDGVGADIITKFVKDQVKAINSFYYDKWNKKPINDKWNNEKVKERQVNNVVKSIKSVLTGDNGPFFLVISNGKLAGVTTGYKNYIQFDSSLKDKNSTNKLDLYANAKNDISSLFTNFQTNVWSNLYDFLQNNWFPNSTASNSTFIVKDSSISEWADVSNTHKTYDPKNADKKPDDSKDDSKDKTPDAKKSFAVDLNKYID